MTKDYISLQVTLTEQKPDGYLVRAKSEIGEAEAITKLPFGEKELEKKLERLALAARGEESLSDGELMSFGLKLYQMVFAGSVADVLKKTMTATKHADGLRIDLDIQSPKLTRIPWELMHDGTDFLALSSRTPIVRWIPSPESGTMQSPQPIELPVRILFAGAKPWGQVPLDLGRQIRRVCKALHAAMQEGSASFHPALGDEVQPNNFLFSLRTGGYHILHISTHGAFSEQLQKGFLLLEDGLGKAFPLAIQTLVGMIRDTKTQIVYLDACETAQTPAEMIGETLSHSLIRSGANAAVAMQFTIRDDHATRFSETFYRYLMEGEPLWRAVTEARIALRDSLGRETLDWAIPALYVRDGYTPTMTGPKQVGQRFGKTEPPSIFVGREHQLDEFADKLLHPSTRVVIVHGFGGIGKSTLIQKMLSEIELLFEDSCLIDCRNVNEITQIVPKINDMLSMHGVPILGERLPSLSEFGRLEYLCEQLNKGRFLVVLDNIDEMQDSASMSHFLDLVEKLSETSVVVACRIPIKPPAYQQQLRVTALDSEHAVAMMREVGRNIPQIMNAEEFDLKRIDEKLRGHPQSIVLAIPYFEGEPFETALMNLPARVASEQEQASKILEWSYSKLSQEEHRFLEHASVFHGEVPMQALLEINDGKDRDILARLVRKNMVEFSPSTGLYSLHLMLREYAYARLGDRKDEIHVKAAREIAPRMVGGFWTEALRLYEDAVASARRAGNQAILAVLLHSLGDMWHRIGEYSNAQSCQDECLEIAGKLGREAWVAAAKHSLGMIEQDQGNYDEAKKLHNESLVISKKLGNLLGIAGTLYQLGIIEEERGNYDEARGQYNDAKAIFEKLGDSLGIAVTLHELANIEYSKGSYDEARRQYNESLEIKRKLGDQSGIAIALHQLGMIEQRKGSYDEARRQYNESLEISKKLGDQSGIASTLHELANIEYSKGSYDEARRQYNESLVISKKLGDQLGIANTLAQLGRLAEIEGDFALAERHCEQALRIFEKLGEKPYLELVRKDLERVRLLKEGT